jgi:hypothetical protein
MKLPALVLTSAIALTATPLLAAITTGNVIGTTEPVIRAALESDGYVIESITIDGDEIEVDATLDDVEVEIELSATTGSVLEIETEDDDDDDK